MMAMAASVGIEQAFNNTRANVKVADLDLGSKMSNNEEATLIKGLIDIINEETIPDALDIIQNLPSAIDSFIKEEMSSRHLNTLKAELLD